MEEKTGRNKDGKKIKEEKRGGKQRVAVIREGERQTDKFSVI